MNIIFAGSIGRFPVGGHAWVDLQYLVGLKELGHTVCYLEDCGEASWVYSWQSEKLTDDFAYPTHYLKDCLAAYDVADCWIYRTSDHAVGMTIEELLEFCATADLMIVRGSPLTLWREEYTWPRRRMYIDSDPGFTQFNIANGDKHLSETIEQCDRLFTIGQNMGKDFCTLPDLGREWIKFAPPIALSCWGKVNDKPDSARYFTAVLQWRSYKESVYEGVSYGNKNKEFPKFFETPARSGQPFQLALTGLSPEKLAPYGWETLLGWDATWTPQSYKAFIQSSRAEFGIAKHGYVLTKGGWFSDRSTCYLASGRPVLLQDTGQSHWLPIGEGVLTFTNMEEALAGVDAINVNYSYHQQAARRIAEDFFDAAKVLPPMLATAMS